MYFGTVSGYGHQSTLDAPENANAYIEVYRWSGSYITIRWFSINGGLSGNVYTRTKNGSTWTAWIKEPTRTEVDALNSKILGYIGKGTLNASVYSAYGWITGGKKTLFLIIPLNLTDDLSTATIASLKVGLRLSTGGYAFGADSTDVTSKITKIVVNKREGVLRVEITSDTDICGTNNICCAGTANLTATFS